MNSFSKLKNILNLLYLFLALIVFVSPVQGQETKYTYNEQGKILTIDGPRLDVEDIDRFTYDNDGNLTSIENALNQFTYFSDYINSLPGKIIDANSVVHLYEYDSQQHLIKQVTQNPQTFETTRIEYAYNNAGDLISVKYDTGLELTSNYDNFGRFIGVTNNNGESITFELDSEGNHLAENISDQYGQLRFQVQKAFDELSHLRSISDVNNATKYFQRDAGGNIISSINEKGFYTIHQFDNFNQIVKNIEANDAQSQYQYDDQGRLIQFTNANGGITSYSYDGYGQLIKENSPDTGITIYKYDEANNLIYKKDNREVEVQYSYDSLNRLIQVNYPQNPEENIYYTYDQGEFAVGKIVKISGQSGSSQYEYNYLGEITSVIDEIGAAKFTTEYVYNSNGQLSKITYPNNVQALYEYDDLGQVIQISAVFDDGDVQTLASDVKYLPFGPVESFTYGNGIPAKYTFNANYQLTKQVIGNKLDRQYSYDENGNIVQIQFNEQGMSNSNFDYDSVDRISKAAGADGTTSYKYDLVGNRTELVKDNKSAFYEYLLNTNKLVNISGAISRKMSLDEVGNLTSDTKGNDSFISKYNQANRLSKVNDNINYYYNSQGLRVLKDVDGVKTYFVYDPSGTLLFESSEKRIKNYFYLNGVPLAVIEKKQSSIGAFSLVNRATGLKLTADGKGLVLVSSSDTSLMSQWEKVDNGVGSFFLKNLKTGKLIRPVSKTENAQVKFVNDKHKGRRVQWDFEASNNEYFHIKNIWSGKFLQPISKAKTTLVIGRKNLKNSLSEWSLVPAAIETAANDKKQKAKSSKLQSTPDTTTQPNATSSTTLHYYHNDNIGTPQILTDEAQNIAWKATYLPFGETQITVNTIENNLRFPGQYYDTETGMHYNFHRDYDPSLGRYLQSDPIGLEGGVNTYGYAYQNPLIYSDSKGQSALAFGRVGGQAGAAIGAGLGPVGAGVGGAIGATIGFAVGYFATEAISDSNESKERSRERKEYSRICKTPSPSSGDKCTDARNNLYRLKQCLTLRENFSRKWFNDGEPGHAQEIQNTRRAISKLEEWIQDNCSEKCD